MYSIDGIVPFHTEKTKALESEVNGVTRVRRKVPNSRIPALATLSYLYS